MKDGFYMFTQRHMTHGAYMLSGPDSAAEIYTATFSERAEKSCI